jgi:O-methyltransferase
MIVNQKGFEYKYLKFRIMRKLRRYRQIIFLPISRPLSFFLIKFKVRKEIRKNGLDGFNDVLEDLCSGVLYSYASFVEGDILEFGTQSGRTASILANSVGQFNSKLGPIFGYKKLHLFDSFIGLPNPQDNLNDKENLFVVNGIWTENGLTGLSSAQLDKVIKRILPRKKYDIYPGFFSESLADFDSKVAFIHIDSDLYSSAYEVLDYLLSGNFISMGCLVMFDDYDLNQANPNSGERLAWSEMILKYKIQFSDRSPYAIFGHRFIIHSYETLEK